jgi:hypothetical protein
MPCQGAPAAAWLLLTLLRGALLVRVTVMPLMTVPEQALATGAVMCWGLRGKHCEQRKGHTCLLLLLVMLLHSCLLLLPRHPRQQHLALCWAC